MFGQARPCAAHLLGSTESGHGTGPCKWSWPALLVQIQIWLSPATWVKIMVGNCPDLAMLGQIGGLPGQVRGTGLIEYPASLSKYCWFWKPCELLWVLFEFRTCPNHHRTVFYKGPCHTKFMNRWKQPAGHFKSYACCSSEEQAALIFWPMQWWFAFYFIHRDAIWFGGCRKAGQAWPGVKRHLFFH